MAFTRMERERRRRALQGVMETADLRALILLGDTNVGNHIYGDFRYYVDHRIIFSRQVAVLFRDSEPVLLVGSVIQQQAASRNSSIPDCRRSECLADDLVALLKDRNIVNGRVGVHLEVLPVNWYNLLRQALPALDLVEAHEQILAARGIHSGEEAELVRACGPLADGGYAAALETIRPGVSEYEIAAAIEEAARARGAEQHFTLIGSGRFALGDRNGLPLPYSPSRRRIRRGDSVVMEITPCLEGYWTQLVRTVNVGEPNAELEKLQRVARGALRQGLEYLKPGKRTRDVVLAVDEYVRGAGYLPIPPYGHFCGVDLVEARVTEQDDRLLQPGTAVIIHPTVQTDDGKNSFFWGETYLTTESGYVCVNHAGDELLTL